MAALPKGWSKHFDKIVRPDFSGPSARLPEVHCSENGFGNVARPDFLKYRFRQHCQKREGSEEYEQTITSHLRPHECQGLFNSGYGTAEQLRHAVRLLGDVYERVHTLRKKGYLHAA
ncbi:MAG: hypothetical protein HFF13_04715 [Angelakisella sp.]|nr:hypothetical protein [Angelakisella sp.]